MAYGKNQVEASYRVSLKHGLRAKGITGFRKDTPTKKLEKLFR